MSLIENNYDFLREITPSNIQKAKANFQFRFNNYHSLYVVDTYDIIEFCFPLIFNINVQSSTQADISKFLSYELFFYNYPEKPIVLDEYKVELYSFWFKLKKSIHEFSNYENLKNELIGKYRVLESDGQKVAFIESNISMLLALAFGAVSTTPLARYNRLVTDRLQIDTFKIDNSNDSRIIEELFYETKYDSERVNRVFDQFCESAKFYLLRTKEEERAIYLENTYRDIKVFDRIININKKLSHPESRNYLKEKYNVLYLSSATQKADAIEYFYGEDLPHFKDVSSESIHRTNIDVYLSQLLNIADGEKQKETIIKFFEKLESVASSFSDKVNQIEEYKKLFSESENDLNSNLLKGGKDIDDIFLMYHSIKEHRIKISEGIKILQKTGSDKALFEEFNFLVDKISGKDNSTAISHLKFSLDQYAFQMDKKYEIVQSFEFLSTNKKSLRLHGYPGKDSIRSLIQSFPILLFYKKQNIARVHSLFKNLINPLSNKSAVLSELISNPIGLLHEFSTYERNLFFLFIRYLVDPELSNDEIIDELNHYLTLNKKLYSEIMLIDGKKMDTVFRESKDLRDDILYFKTWILRRNNQHDQAIGYIDKLLDNDKELDSRLYHSRALCYKNKYNYESSIESVPVLIEYLKKALADFIEAERRYSEIEQKHESAGLLKNILAAITNSIIDTYTKLYLLNPLDHEQTIKESRARLVKLKDLIKEQGGDYNLFAAFGHSEIDLEYCEAIIAFNHDNLEEARFKINEAFNRLQNLMQAPELAGYDSFDKSKNNIKRLYKALMLKF